MLKQPYKDFDNVKEEDAERWFEKPDRYNDFPEKLHLSLLQAERNGLSDVFAWQNNGRCFKIKDAARFEKEILSK